MANQRNYVEFQNGLFGSYPVRSIVPAYARGTSEVCPIPGMNRRSTGSRPGPVGAGTDAGKVIETIEANAAHAHALPAGSIPFDNAWAAGKIDFSLEAASGGAGLKFKQKLKEASASYKTKLNDNIAFVMETNASKSEASFEKFEKSKRKGLLDKKFPANSPRKRARRSIKIFDLLGGLIPTLAFGINIGDSDDENAIIDLLKSIGVLDVLKAAGATDFKYPTLDLKVQTTEFPFVVQAAIGCKFSSTDVRGSTVTSSVVAKVKISFLPNLKWFRSLGGVLSSSRMATLASYLAKNSKVLQVIARAAGIGMQVGSRAFIVIGAILGLIDIGRLAYHVARWLEIEAENEQRLAQIAKSLDPNMKKLANMIYSRSYAERVFPGELSKRKKEGLKRAYKTGAELQGDKSPEPSLKIEQKAYSDYRKAAKAAMAQVELPPEVYTALDKIERQSSVLAGGNLTRQFAEERIAFDIYSQLLRVQFDTARELADAIKASRGS